MALGFCQGIGVSDSQVDEERPVAGSSGGHSPGIDFETLEEPTTDLDFEVGLGKSRRGTEGAGV